MLDKIYSGYVGEFKTNFGNDSFDYNGTLSGVSDGGGLVIMPLTKEFTTLVIGEAPGKEEVLKSLPFQGTAGKNLRTALGDMTSKVYFSNAVKLRPVIISEGRDSRVTVSNRTPSSSEIKKSMPYLLKEFEYLSSIESFKQILLVGNSSLKIFKILLKELAVSGMEVIGTDKLLKSDLPDIINEWINISIGDKKFDLMVVYHTSPLVWNFPAKRNKIIEGIDKFKKGA